MRTNKKFIILVVFLSIFGLVRLYFYKQHNLPKVVYYAKLKQISTSGDARFFWYDTESKEIVDPDNQYSWFFAMPVGVPDDLTTTTNWVSYLEDNSDSVFKITGTKSKADCDYYDKDHCIEDIDISSIEIVSL